MDPLGSRAFRKTASQIKVEISQLSHPRGASRFRARNRAPARFGTCPGAARLPRLAQLLGGFEIDRDQLGDAALRHGHAEQPVHPRHGDRVVGDDHEPRVGEPYHLVE